MSNPVTLAALRDHVRRRTDTENETSRFPNAGLDADINVGIKHFHAERVRMRGQGFDESLTFVTTVAGQELYALPAQLMEVVKVYTRIYGSERQLTPYEEVETDGMVEPSSWPAAGNIGFRMVGNNISFRPAPDAAHTVYIKYVATAVQLFEPSNTVDFVDGFEEFVVAWAAKRIATKNGDKGLAALCEEDMASTLDRLRAIEHARNAVSPPRMLDVRPSPMQRYSRMGRRMP